jgi:putative transposase
MRCHNPLNVGFNGETLWARG